MVVDVVVRLKKDENCRGRDASLYTPIRVMVTSGIENRGERKLVLVYESQKGPIINSYIRNPGTSFRLIFTAGFFLF
jgi:hypothetical protein